MHAILPKRRLPGKKAGPVIVFFHWSWWGVAGERFKVLSRGGRVGGRIVQPHLLIVFAVSQDGPEARALGSHFGEQKCRTELQADIL